MSSPCRNLGLPLLLAALLSCGESNFEPVAPQAIEPPDIYRTWWTEVESCIGTQAPFEQVRWYRAEELVNRDEGTNHLGAWLAPHSIYMRVDALFLMPAVKHEMVHDLLQRPNHETLFFEACAGL
jgi:hypothetical protein